MTRGAPSGRLDEEDDVEPVDVLRQALQAVEGAGIPQDLRRLAFTTAVDLVVSGRGAAAAPRPPAPDRRPAPVAAPGAVAQPGGGVGAAEDAGRERLAVGAPPAATAGGQRPGPGSPRPREDPGGGPEGGGWDRIAAELGVRQELLDRIWDEHAGRLRLTGDVARLGRTRAERVGNAAVLLLAARDDGAPVPDAVLRAEVERLGLLDTGNYTKHLAARRALLATTGSGRTATYKLRYDGVEEARRLARALLEDT